MLKRSVSLLRSKNIAIAFVNWKVDRRVEGGIGFPTAVSISVVIIEG